jgi:hypothetical protein
MTISTRSKKQEEPTGDRQKPESLVVLLASGFLILASAD